MGKQYALFQKASSSKGHVLSQCVLEVSTAHHALLGQLPLFPQEHAPCLQLWRRSHNFSVTLSISCSSFLAPERFSCCVNLILCSFNVSFFPSLLFLQGKVPLPSVRLQCFSPSIHLLCTLHLSCSLLPTVEILLPICRLISWVFQVI